MFTPEMRKKALKAIWAKTHKDFRGKINGEKSIMVYRNGSCLILLNDMTDDEILYKLPKNFSFD